MQNSREEFSVTAHSCLLAVTIPVLQIKETAGVFCVFLKHSEDKILFRIYRARRTGFVFAIEQLNRLFKGCGSYSEA